jgi:acyl-coenzyme A synthetase/AMP-(fatty) acid ligase
MLRQSIESNAVFGANFDKLFVVEALPRGTLGKIQRNELRQMLQDISEQSTLPG